MICPNIALLNNFEPDVCVVGAGPVGIALALELTRRGKTALLLESGGRAASKELQRLSDADILDPRHHAPMNLSVRRQLGGASNLWGGRCVPMDALDFEPRTVLNQGGWPITAGDLAPFLPAACEYLDCGQPRFESPIPALGGTQADFYFDRLERWSLRPNLRAVYLSEIRQSRRLTLCLLATAVGFTFDRDGLVHLLHLRGPGGARAAIRARQFVLAAGGLETTRLLLTAQKEAPNRFGGPEGPLGRYYMGHLHGSVAHVVIHSPVLDKGLDYFNDEGGYCVRRRFWPSAELQRRRGLTNVTLRLEFPPSHDPSHGNGVLSLSYLALSTPFLGRLLAAEVVRRNYLRNGTVEPAEHLRNLVRDFPHVASFIPRYVYRRYIVRSRTHGFFERCTARRYALAYHAEHLPHADSRVMLSDVYDAFGLQRLKINFLFSNADVEPLIATHECFADWLASTGLGTLHWSVPAFERANHIMGQAEHGRHQIGTTRMGATDKTGVVDRDCRVFGAPNLFVAGTSVFCSSGHANPTLTAVALAMRLAHKLTMRDAVIDVDRRIGVASEGMKIE